MHDFGQHLKSVTDLQPGLWCLPVAPKAGAVQTAEDIFTSEHQILYHAGSWSAKSLEMKSLYEEKSHSPGMLQK